MKKRILFILFLLPLFGILHAQTPTDAVMMEQRKFCFALNYDMGLWDHYWEGAFLRTNGNVGTLTRKTIMPMAAIGLHEKINLILSAPYVKTESQEPNGGRQMGASGFQDFGISLKVQLLEKAIGLSKLVVLTNVGFSTPMTNYLSDYLPYSLGFGANEWSWRGIVQYKTDYGFYVQSSLAHLWRGQTEIERDYYYNNGSYYTNLMDVPNAWHFNGAAGIFLFQKTLKLEANYVGLHATSGDDIRKYNAGQPTNKVEIGQIGFSSQYFIKKEISLVAYYSKIISGRNMGQFSNFGLGASYQFKI